VGVWPAGLRAAAGWSMRHIALARNALRKIHSPCFGQHGLPRTLSRFCMNELPLHRRAACVKRTRCRSWAARLATLIVVAATAAGTPGTAIHAAVGPLRGESEPSHSSESPGETDGVEWGATEFLECRKPRHRPVRIMELAAVQRVSTAASRSTAREAPCSGSTPRQPRAAGRLRC